MFPLKQSSKIIIQEKQSFKESIKEKLELMWLFILYYYANIKEMCDGETASGRYAFSIDIFGVGSKRPTSSFTLEGEFLMRSRNSTKGTLQE